MLRLRNINNHLPKRRFQPVQQASPENPPDGELEDLGSMDQHDEFLKAYLDEPIILSSLSLDLSLRGDFQPLFLWRLKLLRNCF
ncbi:MAG: hypothetical protein DWH80_08375 [Planctomycetota bacterium]|nr:MAG: hypothetical protein DWH80_08375 [Planctomycetota bacterium]